MGPVKKVDRLLKMVTKHKQLGLMKPVSLCNRVSVTWLRWLQGYINGIQTGETPAERGQGGDRMRRGVRHLLGVRNTDSKKNTHDSHAALRTQRTGRAVQRNINYMIHEGL